MIKKVHFILFCVLMLALPSMAQQLPDPGFENWGGAQYDGNPQLVDWHASNVTQFGFQFNFTHREAGHSGNYSLMVQGQDVCAAGIVETGPGYAGLGQPWVWVESLTKVAYSTAGMAGGISFAYRPDSMSVWIRRTGDHTADEDFYLIYYGWKGTTRGDNYKGKNGTCASVTYNDEESDIRIAMDYNECGTAVKGTQVCEGYYRARAAYPNWTRIRVPIYYMNNEIPEKVNVMFSASNYPNFRANSGIYAGNSLYVDDVELIYSDAIQSLFIGDVEWRGFDPSSTEVQVYSLGQNATSIPSIEAYRGKGSLTNARGTTVNFPGRKLTAEECVITPGQIDGTPTSLTVTSGDGLHSRTYLVQFVRAASTNSKLAEIRVNGEPIRNFNPTVTSYQVQLPYGTTAAPVVSAVEQENGQTVTITQPTSTTGSATIRVVAADGKTSTTYTIQFSVAQLSDNTLQDIRVNGQSIAGFTPGNTIYRVSLPLGTTTMPVVEAVSAYPEGEQTIVHRAPQQIDGGQYTLSVTTPGNSTAKVYKLNFKLEASSYSYLQSLEMAGGYIHDFQPSQLTYYVTLPLGTTELPAITYTPGDAYQTVSVEPGGLDGTTRVTVTAGNGTDQSVYKIVVNTLRSDRNDLRMIYVGGQPLAGFSPDVLNYTCQLPVGTTSMPLITVDKGDEYETVNILTGGINGTTRITVTAGDGSVRIYQIAFSVATSSDASLDMIYLDGTPLADYHRDTLEYSVRLPKGTTVLPVVTYDQANAYQTVTARSGGLNGDYRLTVRPQTGASRTYIIHFSVSTSSETRLSMISLDGTPMANFDPDLTFYSDTLPAGVSTLPAVTYTRMEESQRVLSVTSGTTVLLTVTAESGDKRTYTVEFVLRKSANAFLRMIYLDGDSLPGFAPDVLIYRHHLDSAALCPRIAVDKNAGQQVCIAAPYSDGEARILVTPESGAPNTYTITFYKDSVAPAPIDTTRHWPLHDTALRAITLDGVSLADYTPAQHAYTIDLPAGSAYPAVGYVPADSMQVVYMAQTAKGVTSIVVRAENDSTATYTVTCRVAPYDLVAPLSIRLEGYTLAYDPAVLDYTVPMEEGASLPDIRVTADKGQTIFVVERNDTLQQVIVTAQSGRSNTYNIYYARERSSNILLRTIILGGDTLPGFDPAVHEYSCPLSATARVVPTVNAIGQLPNQTITTRYCRVGGTMQIEVEAQSGAKGQYLIHFPIAMSGNTALRTLEIEYPDLAFTFDSTVLAYDLELGYTDTVVPFFAWEAADEAARVELESRPLGDTSIITVTAVNGDSRRYRLYFHRKAYTGDNVLRSLRIAETGQVLDASAAAHTVSLPYGTTSLTVEYEKNYPAQTVFIDHGGVYRPTTLTVRANRPGTPDIVYTLTPALVTTCPATLTTLMVDGAPVADFAPERFTYIVNRTVATTPNVTYTSAAGTTVTPVEITLGRWIGQVVSGTDTVRYSLFFHYVNDIIPNAELTDWTSAAVRTSALKPTGWHVAADYADTHLGTAKTGEEVKQSDDKAHMTTTYWAALRSAIPSVMTLGQLNFNFAVAGATSSKFYSGIPYHNTPDSCHIGYNYVKSVGNGARFAFRFFEDNVEHSMDYTTSTTTSGYVDYVHPLSTDGRNITLMNIAVNATDEETDAKPNRTAGDKADLYVDYFRFAYNSVLTSATVNGVRAQKNGTVFTATLDDVLLPGLPLCTFTGEVSDQAQSLTWADEAVEGDYAVRQAAVRNFAEDGTYTDYTLRVRRPLETRNRLSALYLDGEPMSGFSPARTDYTVSLSSIEARFPDILPVVESPLTTVTSAWTDSTLTLTVTPEAGEATIYTLRFVTPLRHETTLAMLTATGITFDAGVRNYDLSATTLPTITYTKLYDRQTVRQQGGVLTVTAEDGTVDTYRISLVRPATTAQLSEISLDGTPLSDFAPATYAYTHAEPVLTDFTRDSELDSVIYIRRQTGLEWQVFGGEVTHTYTVTYPTDLSSDATLAAILVADTLWTDYNGAIHTYSLYNDSAVVIAPVAREGQQLSLSSTAAAYSIGVTAADGTVGQPYDISVGPRPGSSAALSGIWADADLVSGFDPAVLSYTVIVPCAAVKAHQPKMPMLTCAPAESGARIELTPAPLGETTFIDVTSEDGSDHRLYQVLFEAERSHCADLTGISVNGKPVEHFEPGRHFYSLSSETNTLSVTWTTDDAFQTIHISDSVTANGYVYRIHVAAEDGLTVALYEVEVFVRALSNDVTLANILLDGAPMSDFLPSLNAGLVFEPMQNHYTIHLVSGTTLLPEVSAVMNSEGQQVTITCSDMLVELHVTAKDGVSHNTYTLSFDTPLSSDTHLGMIYVGGEPLADFRPETTFYLIDLPVGVHTCPDVLGVAGEAHQTVSDPVLTGNECTILVTAENGAEQTYTLVFNMTRSDADTLRMIYADGIEIAGFEPQNYYYSLTLPVGTQSWPDLSWLEADEWQTVSKSVVSTSATRRIEAIVVRSESGRTGRYSVEMQIALSEVDTLQMIYIDNRPLADFDPWVSEYEYTLPAGSADLPAVFYAAGDAYQTITLDTLVDHTPGKSLGRKVVLHVRAESGSRRDYSLRFPIELSHDSTLLMIQYGADKTVLPDFFSDRFNYIVRLPESATDVPAITVTRQNEEQTVNISVDGWNVTIDVTAEDGVSHAVYTIAFSRQKSADATLLDIQLDGQSLEGFTPEVHAYDILLPNGTTVLPAITWTTANDEQTVTLEVSPVVDSEADATLTVLAADGETPSEYNLHFRIELLGETRLSKLLVRGSMVPGFHPDTVAYTLTYPVGGTSELFAHLADLAFETMDPLATTFCSEDEDGNLSVTVRAQSGAMRSYTIAQTILLDTVCSLRMIYVDGEELDGFDPERTHYTYILPQGSLSPALTYETSSPYATVSVKEAQVGDTTIITCVAENGDRRRYTVLFAYTELNDADVPTAGDVLVKRIPGTLSIFVTTVRKNVCFVLYGADGRMVHYIARVQTADPNTLITSLDVHGRLVLNDVTAVSTTDVIALDPNRVYYYGFYEGEKKKITSGKLMITY